MKTHFHYPVPYLTNRLRDNRSFHFKKNTPTNAYSSSVLRNCCLLYVLVWGGSIQIDLFAQEANFSQWYTNRSLLNPAMSGFDPGSSCAINYRNQWGRLGNSIGKFEYGAIAVGTSAPCLRSNFALVYHYADVGDGSLRQEQAMLGYSYSVPLGSRHNKNVHTELDLGVRAGAGWRSVRWDKFVFTSQLDPIYGVVNQQPSVPAVSTARQYWNVDAGALLQHSRLDIGTLRLRDIRLGIAATHLNRPQASLLLNPQEQLPMRYTVHFTSAITGKYGDRSERLRQYYIAPLLKMDMQRYAAKSGAKMLMDWSAGFLAGTQSICGGVGWRSRNLIPVGGNLSFATVTFGLEGGNAQKDAFVWQLLANTELNVGRTASPIVGAAELSLILNPTNASFLCRDRIGGKNRHSQPDCPREHVMPGL
jgi:type IX secretion system PorP/SprF family membrane protein